MISQKIPDWAISDAQIEGRSFRIVDLTGADRVIANKTFLNCTIYGPAVVVLVNGGELTDCSLGGPPDALLWSIDENRDWVIGAVAADNCSFIGCNFQGVGFAGKPDFVEMLKSSIQILDAP